MSAKKELPTIKELANDPEALAELLRRYTMYKEALDSMPGMVVIHDEDWRLIDYNETFHKTMVHLGLDKTGGTDVGLTFERMRDLLEDYGNKIGKKGVGERYYKYHTKSWEDSLVSGKMVEVKDIQGRWQYYGVKQTHSGYFVDYRTDITAQKALQTQFQEVLEHTNQGVAIFDRSGKLILLNPAFLEFWKFQEFDWFGKTVFEALDYAHKMGTIGKNIATEEEWLVFRNNWISSQMNICEKTSHNINLDNGRRLKFASELLPNGQAMFLYDDITEIEVQKEALQEEKLKAEAGEHAKAEFLANMSHEIRTPMNGVMGMAEILMGTDLNAQQRSFASTIVRSGNALLTIINDILDFSKIGAQQMTLSTHPFNLTDAIEDVTTLLSGSAREKNIALAVRVAPDIPQTVIGDVGRVRQILTNLVGNAVKFTDQGHVLVNVTGEADTLEGHEHALKLRVEIKDTGIGIPQDQLGVIFEKFRQVDGSSARKHEGTGLGLAITSSLVDLMGGDIGVESVYGQGSTFWFEITLPAETSIQPSTASIVTSRATIADATDAIMRARILIIDDNEISRSILTEQVQAWGFEWKAAASSEEALKYMSAAHLLDISFDLIILDDRMASITHNDIAKQNHNIKETPIILLASVDNIEASTHFTDCKPQAQLTKPVRSSLLLSTINSTLQNSYKTKEGLQKGEGQKGEGQKREGQKGTQPSEAPSTVSKFLNPTSLHQTESDTQNFAEATIKATPTIGTDAPQTHSQKDPTSLDILIAEDNEVNQMVFIQTVKTLSDFTYRIANNGQEAVELYKKYSPSLILMDVSMPVMNGLEATIIIRELEKETKTHTPIIGITAHTILGDKEECLVNGMDDYLPKPISPKKLSEKIYSWFEEIAQKTA